MSLEIPSLKLVVPDGWELALELRLVEPEGPALSAPLAIKESVKRPRANLSVIRRAAEATTPQVMLAALLRNLTVELPGLKKLDEGAVRFADGVEGASATVTYELETGVNVVQRHVYRIDGAVLTHFVASAEARDRAKLDRVLQPVLASFRA